MYAFHTHTHKIKPNARNLFFFGGGGATCVLDLIDCRFTASPFERKLQMLLSAPTFTGSSANTPAPRPCPQARLQHHRS